MSLSDLITKHINTKQTMTDTELLNITKDQVSKLSPAQKKRRTQLYKNKWWKENRSAAAQAKPQVNGDRPPGWLTSSTMIEKHPEEIKYCAEVGAAEAFKQKPELKDLLLGRGENMMTLYQAVSLYRKRHGKAGGRNRFTAEQYALARQIMNDPQFRTLSGEVEWTAALRAHPEWAEALGKDKLKLHSWRSFLQRVKNGEGTKIEDRTERSPVQERHSNGHGIVIGGREYSVPELEQIINAQRNTVEPMRFCPHCGHNMQMFSKAYSIAKKHSEE